MEEGRKILRSGRAASIPVERFGSAPAGFAEPQRVEETTAGVSAQHEIGVLLGDPVQIPRALDQQQHGCRPSRSCTTFTASE